METTAFTAILDVSAPVLILILVGTLLRKRRIIDDGFIASGSRFVFAVGMPTLLFFSMLGADPGSIMGWQMPAFFSVGIILTFAFAWWLAGRLTMPNHERGVFIQMAFRGNTGVFSLALVVNMFGEEGVVIGGVFASITSIMFNILAELALSRYQQHSTFSYRALLRSIVTNPMILGVVAGISVNYLNIPIPKQIVTAGKYLGSATLPLALLCVGASLATSAFVLTRTTSLAMFIKIFVSPVVLTTIAAFSGFSDHELVYLFLFFGAPVAASAYVVSIAHGSDGKQTANAIATSTLLGSGVIILVAPVLLAFLSSIS
ncbi:AEC family transporter [Maribrevibacterium harenarium]|uniref:AEC family transporter n=1 Tax=Maribrevibacterium harenarium TaxID=2589817 RepID=A0A501WI30_9GAMM|nr:AEC family transporter [Maribrevibacterium harenarium]TPE49018.1 AEC family transporter [Maribrevibacterium harenarium]